MELIPGIENNLKLYTENQELKKKIKELEESLDFKNSVILSYKDKIDRCLDATFAFGESSGATYKSRIERLRKLFQYGNEQINA